MVMWVDLVPIAGQVPESVAIIIIIILCREFTTMYLKQTIFLAQLVLHLFCITICATCNLISPMKYVLYF